MKNRKGDIAGGSETHTLYRDAWQTVQGKLCLPACRLIALQGLWRAAGVVVAEKTVTQAR